MEKRISVLVVDHREPIRTALSKLLSQEEDVKSVITAETPFAAQQLLKSFRPDVVIMELDPPKLYGAGSTFFIKKFKRTISTATIMMASNQKECESELAHQAIRKGASFVIPEIKMNRVEIETSYKRVIASIRQTMGLRNGSINPTTVHKRAGFSRWLQSSKDRFSLGA